MLTLLPLVLGVAVVAWLLWPALVEAVDRMSWPGLAKAWGYQPRHNARLIVKKWQAEEAAYQAALDKVWIGALADMAARARARQGETWLLT